MPVTINGTTGIAGVDGSAGTPAVQGSDTNTGVYFPTADTISASTGGTERMRIDSSGNVGIGTASPGSKLTVYGASGAGINITNATTGTGATNGFQLAGGSGGDAYIWNYSNSFIAVATNNTERMRIDSSGNLLVGTTTALVGTGTIQAFKSGGTVASFAVNGGYDAAYVYNIANTGYTSFRFSVNNNATAVGSIAHSTTATAYNTTSDYRLKEDYRPVSNALERIAALKPINFAWKSNGERVDGFLAHEAAEVVPEAITGAKDAVDEEGKPVYQGIDQSKLVPLLTAALQEALTEISSLKARVAALETA